MKRRARSDDPETSQIAAQEIVPHLPAARQRAFDMVSQHNGRTTNELAEIFDVRDPRSVGRRLTELNREGLIRREVRQCSVTNRFAFAWFLAEPKKTLTLF